MLAVLFLFSGIFFFKSMIFSIIYSNYLMYLYYPLEIASLSLINNNNTLDYELSHYNTYLRWAITNWIGIEEDYNILDNVNKQSEKLIHELSELKDIENLRNCGLIIGFDLSNTQKRNMFVKESYKNGLICNTTGEKSIRLRPNLNLCDSETMKAIKIFKRTIKDVNRF